MAKVPVYNMEGTQVEEMELSDAVFGAPVKEHLIHSAVVQYLANQRQGTQSARNRSEVRGGGRKPWRQKGTGRARQGSIRAPQWKGGGVVFPPKPRSYRFKLNRREKQAALRGALTSKVQDARFIVLDELTLDEIKTKKMKAVLENLHVKGALVVMDTNDRNVVLSARNLPGVQTALVNTINTYDILKYETIVTTKAGVAQIEEVYA